MKGNVKTFKEWWKTRVNRDTNPYCVAEEAVEYFIKSVRQELGEAQAQRDALAAALQPFVWAHWNTACACTTCQLLSSPSVAAHLQRRRLEQAVIEAAREVPYSPADGGKLRRAVAALDAATGDGAEK